FLVVSCSELCYRATTATATAQPTPRPPKVYAPKTRFRNRYWKYKNPIQV
ncbi:hypothetical protein Droror1_Dr00028029, partial [Drosera rotundifolia]